MKKIILLLIDSLMPNDLENVIKSGKAPALRFLFDNGYYNKKCTTAFPTMTASVDATLMTGTYPDKHKIPALLWYNPNKKRIIDYVNGTKTVLSIGFKKSARDVLIHLNEKHLNKKIKTIFEELSENGRSSGSVNFIIHRGKDKYKMKPPLLFNLFTAFSLYNYPISGPEVLSIGSFFKPKLKGRTLSWNLNQSIINRFGINDDYAIEVTKEVIASGEQPDFLAIYLPDHDHYLHRNINRPLESLQKVDSKITKLLNAYDSWNTALDKNIFIIIGDHGQTEIGKNKRKNNISLDKLLENFTVTKLGKKVQEKDEVIFANNERMTYIYPLKDNKQKEIINVLLKESRIDFVAWKKENQVIVRKSSGEQFIYALNGDFIDEYGQNWNVEGDSKVLDITVKDRKILFDKYPDALSRLYGALFSQDIPSIVISAKPGYEFYSKTFPTHLGGGSHGSLHEIDSVVPFLVAGVTKKPKSDLRIVDMKNYILQLLNVNSTTTG